MKPSKVRSLLFYSAFFAWTAFITVPFIFLFLLPRRVNVWHLAWWAKGAFFLLRVLVGIRYEIIDPQNVPRGTALIISNHQSVWETIVFHILTADPCFIMKQNLLRIPFYGWHARHVGMIGLDRRRSATQSMKKMLRLVPERLRRGQSVIIFPEGTRVPSGESLPYSKTVYNMYEALSQENGLAHVPAVPVAHNAGLYWPKSPWVLQPGTVRIRFLSAIPKGLEKRAFLFEIERKIREAQKTL